MKLNIVPARQGTLWVKWGIQTFLRQPLALSGLLFLFMLMMFALGAVPLVGNALALLVLPGATLGLMVATKEASHGNFPMPTVLISAFRAGRQQLKSMLVLGVLYAVGFLLVLAMSVLVDGGKLALAIMGGGVSIEDLQQTSTQLSMLIIAALCLPLSVLFWHAPALVHWHGVSPVKSLFFSAVACMRNFGAFTLYGLGWLGFMLAVDVLMVMLSIILGSTSLLVNLMFPVSMLMTAMIFTSIYFTFRDCFEPPSGDTP